MRVSLAVLFFPRYPARLVKIHRSGAGAESQIFIKAFLSLRGEQRNKGEAPPQEGINSTLHQSAADSPALILWVHNDVPYGGVIGAIGNDPGCTDQAASIPSLHKQIGFFDRQLNGFRIAAPRKSNFVPQSLDLGGRYVASSPELRNNRPSYGDICHSSCIACPRGRGCEWQVVPLF